MTIKIDKQVVKNAYEWVKYSGKQDQQIEQLYQASTGMVTGVTTQHSSVVHGYEFADYVGLMATSKEVASGKSVQLCDSMDIDPQLASRVTKCSKYRMALAGVHYDLLVVVQAIKQGVSLDVAHWVADQGEYGSDFDELIHQFNQDLRVHWYTDRPLPGYPILVKYLQMIEDYLWCNFTEVVGCKEQYKCGVGESHYRITNKHNLINTQLRVFDGEVYSFNSRPNLPRYVANGYFNGWVDSYSLEECQDKLRHQMLKLLPCLTEGTHKAGLFNSVDSIWLDYLQENNV